MAKKVYSFINGRQKNNFLNAYVRDGTIGCAAMAVGLTRQTHYNWLKEDPAYAKAFAKAREMAADLLEEEARRRAVEGDEVPVYYKGKKVDAYRKKSDALLILLLKGAKPEIYADRQETTLHGDIVLRAADALKAARERVKNAWHSAGDD